ncbi:hypothetical protein KUTeg_011642 [Tegillarca granosa]|uniref:Uncharacterized protein n=1 Tax=Tegillarca granosa TaxID=220873 RepID=A0ABQ9F1N7_TEGGR|nr:hypothetical protein KUTeg_011642 [Tegillarca granosa]
MLVSLRYPAGKFREKRVTNITKRNNRQNKKELAVDVRSLSSTIRKKTSASDSRPSAAGVGVLGVVLIVSLITSIVVSDLGRMYTGVKKLYKLCHKRICRIKN